MPDTIAAIATANAPGGIGIVRVSGPEAFGIAQRVFRPKHRLDWSSITGYHMAYGTVGTADDAGRFEEIDEGICLLFRGPKSYTGEDVAELQCHGGPLLLQRVLQSVLDAGCRLAAPGEFTRRAWLGGRIDLTQAEAVMRLIHAQSEQSLRAAHGAMGSALAQRIADVRGSLITLAAHISAWTDYPEEDVIPLHDAETLAVLQVAEHDLSALLSQSKGAQAVLDGVTAALAGRPNVGKSSLLNRLAGYERAIVTDLPGTTRDTVTETIRLGNLTLRLTDTAGLRDTDHPVEQAGVARSVAAMQEADLVLAVLDATQPIGPEEADLLAKCDPERTILVFNKMDRLQNAAAPTPPPAFSYIVHTSAKTGEGLEQLASTAETLCQTAGFMPGEAMLATQRQTQCAAEAHAAVVHASAAVVQGFAPDAVSVCLEDAVQALFSLTGERASDAVVDEVFARFCVGK